MEKKYLSQIFCVFAVTGCTSLQITDRTPAQVSSARLCSENTSAIGADDSTEKLYFEALLKRGAGAPIEDFLHLWYPERDKQIKYADSYLANCRDNDGHVRYIEMHCDELVPSCAPDTLYSWQWPKRTEAMFKTFPNGEAWRGDANPLANQSGGGFPGISATISPVSTYSYGSILVRYKIKPGTKFNDSWNPKQNEVGVPPYKLLQDFQIGFEEVVESFSAGTPEIYDEIVKDIRQFISGETAVDFSGVSQNFTGMDRVYHAGVAERGPQDESTLKSRLLKLITTILNHQGQINFASGVCQNRRAHDSTLKPTYFNSLTPAF